MKHRLIPCVMIQPDSLHPLLPSPTAHGVQEPTGLFFFFYKYCIQMQPLLKLPAKA